MGAGLRFNAYGEARTGMSGIVTLGDKLDMARHPRQRPSAGIVTLGDTDILANARPRRMYTAPMFGGYGKPRRPVRPPAGVPLERLWQLYPDLVQVQQRRIELYGTGHRVEDQLTLGWEAETWKRAGLDDEAPLNAAAAQDYVAHLWARYALDYEPWFSGVPHVRVLHGDDWVNGARSYGLRHCIHIDSHLARRPWLVHETAHFLAPHVMHDAPWQAVVVQMWAGEFGVPVAYSRRLAREGGLPM
jgi:hypothetical protein